MPKIKKQENPIVYVDAESLQKIKDLREVLAINSQVANIYLSLVLAVFGGYYLGLAEFEAGLIAALLNQFFLILPYLYYYHPRGLSWSAVPQALVEDETLTKADADKIIYELESLYRYRNYYAKFAQLLLIVASVLLLVKGLILGEYSASAIQLALTNFAAVTYRGMLGDPLIKSNLRSIDNNREIGNVLLYWHKQLNIAPEIKKILNNNYAILDFNDVKLLDKSYSRKEIRYIFEILLASHNFIMNLRDDKKIMFRLNSASALTKVNEIIKEKLQFHLELERELVKVENQLFSIRNEAIISYQYIRSNNLERYYKVKLYLPDEISMQLQQELASRVNFIESKPLTFITSTVLSSDTIAKFINANKLLIFDEAPSFLNPRVSEGRDIVGDVDKPKPKGKEKERELTLLKRDDAINSHQLPRANKAIRWPSVAYDGSTKDKVVPIEDGYGRFFTYRNFNEDDFEDEQLYRKFKKVISDHPKFARARKEEGIKYDKSIKVKTPNGGIKTGGYKAKLLNNYGQFRMAAYEETAETGEVLYVFARNNLYTH